MKEEEATAIETHAYHAKVSGFFGLILKNQKVLSGVVISLGVAALLGIVGFTYKTATLPAQEKQIIEIKKDVEKVVQYQANDVVDKAIQKLEVNNLKISVGELKEEMKANFLEIKTMLRANTGIVKQIDKNTK